MMDNALPADDPCEGIDPFYPFLFAYLVRLRRCGEAR